MATMMALVTGLTKALEKSTANGSLDGYTVGRNEGFDDSPAGLMEMMKVPSMAETMALQ